MLLNLEKSGSLLKSSKEVYFKEHCYTSPEGLRAVIEYLKKIGAKVYVMENSTQANMTRIVFTITGYKKICDDLGVKIIYLDEEETETFEFKEILKGIISRLLDCPLLWLK